MGQAHAAIANRLVRPKLRPPASDREIVVSFDDLDANEAAGVVADALEEEFGVVDWIEVEVGHENLINVGGYGGLEPGIPLPSTRASLAGRVGRPPGAHRHSAGPRVALFGRRLYRRPARGRDDDRRAVRLAGRARSAATAGHDPHELSLSYRNTARVTGSASVHVVEPLRQHSPGGAVTVPAIAIESWWSVMNAPLAPAKTLASPDLADEANLMDSPRTSPSPPSS